MPTIEADQETAEAIQVIDGWIESLQEFNQTLHSHVSTLDGLTANAADPDSNTHSGDSHDPGTPDHSHESHENDSSGDPSQDSSATGGILNASRLLASLASLQQEIDSLTHSAKSFAEHLEHEIQGLAADFHEHASSPAKTAGDGLMGAHPHVPEKFAQVSSAITRWKSSTEAQHHSIQETVGRVTTSLASLSSAIQQVLDKHCRHVSEDVSHEVAKTLNTSVEEIAKNLTSILQTTVAGLDNLQTSVFDSINQQCNQAIDAAKSELNDVQSNLRKHIESRLHEEIQERLERLISEALAELIIEIEQAVQDTTLSQEITAAVSPYMLELIAVYHLADAIEAALKAKKAVGL